MIHRTVLYAPPFVLKSMLSIAMLVAVVACGGGGGSGGDDTSVDSSQQQPDQAPDTGSANNTLTRDVYLQMPATDSMTLLWQTELASDSEIIYSPSLEELEVMAAGMSPGVEVSQAVSQAINADNDSTLQHTAGNEKRLKHELTLTGLKPEQRYYYVVRDGKKNLTQPSDDRYFVTLPLSLATSTTRAWVLGNTGIDAQSTMAVRNGYQLYSGDLPTDLLLLLGNNIPKAIPYDYNTALFQPLQSVLYNTALWPTLGAFEAQGMDSNVGVGDPNVPYFTEFKLPERGEMGGSISNTEAYYSFNHGDTHFISLNTLGLTQSIDKTPVQPGPKNPVCVTSEEKFFQSIWPILADNCSVCHQSGGPGPIFNLVPSDANSSYEMLLDYAGTDARRNKIWQRAGGAQGHGGGNVLGRNPSDLAALHNYMDELSVPETCSTGNTDPSSADSSVQMVFSTQMLDWLKSDLSLTIKKWTVVYMHNGPYSKGSVDSDVDTTAAAIRNQLIPIFDQHDVDLVLSAQSQSYERSYLIKGHAGLSNTFDSSMIIQTSANTYPKPLQAGSDQGVTYIVAGAASKTIAAALDHPAMPVGISDSGSVVLDIVDNRIEVQFIDIKGERIEQVDITKGQDLRQPRLMRGHVKSANRITLVFNERLNSDIGDISAYKLTGPDGDIAIRSVALSANQRVITLIVDDLPARKKLTVEVDGVADLAGNMAIGESTRVFSRFGSSYKPGDPKPPTIPPQPEPPVIPGPQPEPPVIPPMPEPEPPTIPPMPEPEPPTIPPQPEPEPEPPKPENMAPVAANDRATTAADKAVSIDVLQNDSDPDGDAIYVSDFDVQTANGGTVRAVIGGSIFEGNSDAINIAATGTASQSSTQYNAAASRAIDGNTSGSWGSNSITHTVSANDSWWELTLDQTVHNLDRIALFNRGGKAQKRLSNFRVSVFNGDTEVFGENYFETGSVDGNFEIVLPKDTSGDRVRIQLNGENNYGDGVLSLAEVEVFALPVVNTNVALAGAASQSSTGYGGNEALANDDNTDGSYAAGSVTHTKNDTNAFWQVKLSESVSNINQIVIFNRTDGLSSRLSNFRVTIMDGQRETFANDYFKTGSVDVSHTIDLPVGINGDLVRVQFNGKNNDGDGYLSLAEVQVWAGNTTSNEATGQLVYTPATGFTGNDTFNYSIGDGNGGSDSAIVNIVVQALANNAPAANDDDSSVEVGKTVSINVLSNDSDTDGDTLSVESFTQGAKGTVQTAANNALSYTANADASGTDSFTYTINDGNGESATATVNITITAQPNVAPVAVDDAASVESDMSVTVNVLGNDSDANDDTLSVTAITQGSKGTVTRNRNNSVTYKANANTNGSDSFTYTISDGNGESATATVNITITAQPNTAPELVNDSASVQADASITINVLVNDSDVDNDILSVTSVTQGSKGSVMRNENSSVSYKANANASGIDSFTYTVSDGMDMATATVNVTITPVPNTAPVANNDSASVQTGQVVTVSVLANDSDADGDALTVSTVTQGSKGSVQRNSGNVRYTANVNASGTDSFTYTVSDGKDTDTARVNITITPVPNTAPVASNDSANVKAGEAVTLNVLANDRDADGDSLSVTRVTQGSKGQASIDGNGSIRYVANTGSSGNDSFTYTLSDGVGGTDTAQVVVTIEAVVVPPPIVCDAEDFYRDTVKNDVGACIGCHVAGGIAGSTDLIMSSSDNTLSISALKGYGNTDANIQKLLNKSIGVPSHGGGNQFGNSSDSRYQNLEKLLTECETDNTTPPPVTPPPVTPPPVTPPTSSAFEKVLITDSKSTLRKAAILMAGRLPTQAEYNRAATEAGMSTTMRSYMSGVRFGEFVKDTANRTFLTAGMPEPVALSADFTEFGRIAALDNKTEYNAAIADMEQEPLELVRYIIENDRSYKEILTANYTMVNRRLEKVYNANLVDSYSNNDEWTRARIPAVSQRSDALKNKAYPHAGVLTSNAWLSRFPTTASNRNRHRTAKFLDQFLGIDLEAFGQRPIDDSANDSFHVPTLQNPNCLACHTMMDPIAGGFANWGSNNQYWQDDTDSLDSVYRDGDYQLTEAGDRWYKQGDSWYRDFLTPGFEGKTMPGGHAIFDQNATVTLRTDRSNWSTVAASSSENVNELDRVLDGNATTAWTSKYSGAYPRVVTIDMGSRQRIEGIVLSTPGAVRHPGRYDVRVSTNGTSWSNAAAGSFSRAEGNGEDKTIEFSNSQNVRYFQFRIHSQAGNYGVSTVGDLYALQKVDTDNDIGQENANGGTDRLQWLAREAVEDARFADGTVRFWYKGLFGQLPIYEPQDSAAADYAQQMATYNTQQVVLDKVAKDFADSGFKIKDLLVSLMSSELFRADGTTQTLTDAESNALSKVGYGRLLSAAEVNAKTKAIVGFPLFEDVHTGLGLTFSGFDGGEILTNGITDLTPSSLTAFETSVSTLVCDGKIAINDLDKAQNSRTLFPFAGKTQLPGRDDAAIKKNIQHLFNLILDEDLPLNDPEINTALAMITSIYQNSVADGSGLRVQCERGVRAGDRNIVRAYNALITYLLTDFRFISE